MRQLGVKGLYISGETPYRYQLAMAVPRDQTLLVGILDKVLADLSPMEIDGIQEQWVGGVIDQSRFWQDFLLYGLPGLLLLSIVLLVVIRINRRLSSEISRRIALEQELRQSEYHYRGLVESLSAIAWEASMEDFTYNYVSPHAEDLLGYPLADWLKPGFWHSIVHPADVREAERFCDQETRLGRDHSLDYRVLRADGKVIWVRDLVSLIQHGLRPVMRGLMIDISETKQTEDALRLSEEEFASVFRQCPDILIIARLADGCRYRSQQGLRRTNRPSRRRHGRLNRRRLNVWGSLPALSQSLLARLQVGSIRKDLEVPFRRVDGRMFARPDFRRTLRPRLPIQPLVIIVAIWSPLKEAQQDLQIFRRESRRSLPLLLPTAC